MSVRAVLLLVVVACLGLAPSAFASGFTGWMPAGALTIPRGEPAAARLADGRVLVVGGQGNVDFEALAAAELYDPATNAWSMAAPMSVPRLFAGIVTLRDGRVLVVGGSTASGQRVGTTAEVYDPQTNTWTPTGPLRTPRAVPGIATLADGRVLVAGIGDRLSDNVGAPGAEIYDPSTNRWTATRAMTTARQHPAVAPLPDGRVLAAGGANGGSLASAEIYDASTDSWTAVASMSAARQQAGVATLPDGRVLVAGGESYHEPVALGDGTVSSAELFDPSTGAWTTTPAMVKRRGDSAVMATLADGRPVFVGGTWWRVHRILSGSAYESTGYFEPAADVYDPALGTWSESPSTIQRRDRHVAVALLDGSLLVAGGTQDGRAERLMPVPAPPPAPVPSPAPPTPTPTATPAPKPGMLRFVDVPKRLKASRTSVITLKLRCTRGDCRDRVTIKRAHATLAQATVTARAGRTVTARIKLGATARKTVARRSLRVTLELTQQRTKITRTLRAG